MDNQEMDARAKSAHVLQALHFVQTGTLMALLAGSLTLPAIASATDHYFDATNHDIQLRANAETGQVTVDGTTYEPGRFIVHADGEWIMMLVTQSTDALINGETVRVFDWDQGMIHYAKLADGSKVPYALSTYNTAANVSVDVDTETDSIAAMSMGNKKGNQEKPNKPQSSGNGSPSKGGTSTNPNPNFFRR